MPERIICTLDQNMILFENGKKHLFSSNFIKQYCDNHEQIIRKSAWKSEGIGARFRMDRPVMGDEHVIQLAENAKITGLASDDNGEIIFCVTVGDSSGIFKRSIKLPFTDSEGHILHDRKLAFFDIATSPDGRMAFSILNGSREQNIAIAETGSPIFREITEGDSIDRNPFWDTQKKDTIYFDSAPIAYGHNRNHC